MSDMTEGELASLVRIERFLASLADEEQLLTAIIGETAAAVDAESASLALLDEAAGEFSFYVVAGGAGAEREFERRLRCLRLPADRGLIGWCAARRRPVNIPDAAADERFDPRADQATGFRTGALLAVPLVRRDRLLGVVEAVNKRGGGTFEARDEQLLLVLAAQAALVLENARLYRENLEKARLAALGEGIAGAAHCVKNILGGIGSGVYLLEEGRKGDKPAFLEKGGEIVRRASAVLKGLVLDMLDFARPREPEYAPVDPNQLAADAVAALEGRAREQGVRLELETGTGTESFVLDRERIFRCLLNLGANGIDACRGRDDGRVVFAVRAAPGFGLELAVSDNGCGIKEEDQRRLFTLFYSTKGSKGTGLGLSVSQKIVQEHGGELRLASAPGRGSTFTVLLPARDREAAGSAGGAGP